MTQGVIAYTGADVCHQDCCWHGASCTLYSVRLQDVKGMERAVDSCRSERLLQETLRIAVCNLCGPACFKRLHVLHQVAQPTLVGSARIACLFMVVVWCLL